MLHCPTNSIMDDTGAVSQSEVRDKANVSWTKLAVEAHLISISAPVLAFSVHAIHFSYHFDNNIIQHYVHNNHISIV